MVPRMLPAKHQTPGLRFTPVPPSQRSASAETPNLRTVHHVPFGFTLTASLPTDSGSKQKALAGSAPDTGVVTEGPTAGPLGLVIPFSTPSCSTTDGNQAVLVIFVDYQEIGYYTGSALDINPLQLTFWTQLTPNGVLGTHQVSFACYDSGVPENEQIILFNVSWEGAAAWKDNGFSFDNTGPSIPTELSASSAGPGYILTTSAGAPTGPTPCPTIDATPWQRIRITFYSWSKGEWLPEETYSLADSAVSQLSALPIEIPLGAKDGESLGVTVGCDRPSTYRGALDVEFDYYAAYIYLDAPVGGRLSAGELAAGGHNPAEFCVSCFMSEHMSFGQPVDAPTGNFWHSFPADGQHAERDRG
jgi:hypothetical protein